MLKLRKSTMVGDKEVSSVGRIGPIEVYQANTTEDHSECSVDDAITLYFHNKEGITHKLEITAGCGQIGVDYTGHLELHELARV